MRILLTAAFLMLPLTAAYAQTEAELSKLTPEQQEVADGIDTLMYCATTFAMGTQVPGVPEEKVAQYEKSSSEMFDVAIAAFGESGVDDATISDVANAYVEEVGAAIAAGEDLRFSEEQCVAGYDAMNAE